MDTLLKASLVKTPWGFFCPDWCNDAPPEGEAHMGMSGPGDFSEVVHYGQSAGWTFMEWPKPDETTRWPGIYLTIDIAARSDLDGYPTRPFLRVDEDAEEFEVHDPDRAALLCEVLSRTTTQLLGMTAKIRDWTPPGPS